MDALGRLYDIALVAVPTDAVAGAITGKRVNMRDCSGVTFVVIGAAGSTDILDLDVQEANAKTGGTSQDLDRVTYYHHKSATTLAGTEQWVRVAQTAASEITDIGLASQQNLVAVHVDAAALSDGFDHVSVNVPDLGTNGTKFVAIIAILDDLTVQRAPAKLRATLDA